MRNKLLTAILGTFFLLPNIAQAQDNVVNPPSGNNICEMSSLDLSPITCLDDNGKTKVNANKTTKGNAIVINGITYTSGVGVHAPSKAVFNVKGAKTFKAILGVNDEASDKAEHGIVDYKIYLYKNKQKETVKEGTLKRQSPSEQKTEININLEGADYLMLDLLNGAQPWADEVSWANAYFEYTGEQPTTTTENKIYADDKHFVELPAKGPNDGDVIALSSLDLTPSTCGWKSNQKDKSVNGNPIKISGITYSSGVGSHAASQIIVKLNGAVTHFHTVVGIDDEVDAEAEKVNTTTNRRAGTAQYKVYLKGEDGNTKIASQGVIRHNDAKGVQIDVDCNGWKYLFLETEEGEGGNESDHIDWANAYFEYHEQNSTPPAIISAEELSSKLACATVLFSQPGVKFMHKLRPANRDAKVSVSNLPEGLVWNERRGLVEGIITTEGEYTYTANVTIDGETKEEPIRLTVSSSLQQPVPFMGWLSWNVVQGDISEEVIKKVANAFHTQGLLDAGYTYLCIDDLWHADQRAADGKPLPDKRKFPNGMKTVADYVHDKGLKFGIYSDAAERTCAGRFGSYGYEQIDAKQYAEWGVDLLKYDYCGAPSDATSAEKRYKTMGDALKASGRDILFYMCEWGVREPWKWGVNTGATTWRCTYDTRDGWNGKNGGIGIVQSIAGMKDIWAYSGPNRFNDADMMCVGIHGTGKSSNDLVDGKPGMTQTEYKTQFSLWCMWSSPLTLSFDLTKTIKPEDLAIMTHEELIALNQDRMGQQAELISEKDGMIVFAKDLENGDLAISVTNMNANSRKFTFDFKQFSALETGKSYHVRDLWQKKDMGMKQGSFDVTVASHETLVYRLSKKEATGIINTNNDDIKITASQRELNVETPSGNNSNKRILISDRAGRIIASATGRNSVFTFPLKSYPDVCIVNVTYNGHSRSLKFKP